MVKPPLPSFLNSVWFLIKLFCTGINFLSAAGFIYLWLTSLQMESSYTIYDVKKAILNNMRIGAWSAEVLSTAQQLGRLDYVTFSLTVLGVIIAVSGFIGFWMIREEAIRKAEETVTSPDFVDKIALRVAKPIEDAIYKKEASVRKIVETARNNNINDIPIDDLKRIIEETLDLDKKVD